MPDVQKSDHFNGEVFFNPEPTSHPSFFRIFRHVVSGRNSNWPDSVLNPEIYTKSSLSLGDTEYRVTFINHASFLIETKSANILTDPVWSNRVGPFSWAGPERGIEPGIPFELLPKIDIVLISHNHYDHMDLPSLQRLNERFHPIFIVPKLNKDLLKSVGIETVYDLDWWQTYAFNDTLKVMVTPSRHNSGRGLTDRDKTLWGSFAILHSNGGYIYFAGDTSYGSHFKQIASRLGKASLALLPIGAYEPRDMMKDAHINPQEAVLAHLDLEAKLSIAMHFGTFNLSSEDRLQPVQELMESLGQKNIDRNRFLVIKEGSSVVGKL
ncbi:hypothetical protein LPTSP4_19010 [Leptospira ryugenii]|uniref:Metallo-beta-lactamase domain-containing protein n=1 Tax=Leptospira ryugenii TaxID=1917863 RepID=A0A2P2E0Q7_9LEPT|nr:MBL fold metallo-hydrolase [Leptospira ryugenii]GBF50376.1 hypothetical protein LPTSP4_19010 [Leptospira ryugenii]